VTAPGRERNLGLKSSKGMWQEVFCAQVIAPRYLSLRTPLNFAFFF
jgi:hypothetical protein